MSAPVENLVERLHAKRSGEGWKAKCPVHDDRDPSLSIREGSDGRALIKCHAGCQTNDVLAAIGLKPRDLFVSGKNGSEPPKQTLSRKTNEEKAEPINWQQCVDAFTEKHLARLSDWRGYSWPVLFMATQPRACGLVRELYCVSSSRQRRAGYSSSLSAQIRQLVL